MNEPETDDETKPLDAIILCDRICDRFEAEWKSAGSPNLEDFLSEAPEEDQAELFGALLELELEYRRRRGERPTPVEYSERFARFIDCIQRAFDPETTVQQVRGIGPTPTAAAPSMGAWSSSGSRFRVVRPHAKGGLGEVFLAYDVELNREVALKEIQQRYADDPRFRSRFEFEAEVTGGLEHPGIVPVYGLGRANDGRPFYAMRFIKGDTLRDAVLRFHKAEKDPNREWGQSTLELRELLGRFIDVCDAVAYAHSRGVIHRDLKPSNIMLGKYGETLVVDWGLAKAIEEPESNHETERSEAPLKPSSGSEMEPTAAGAAVGTPAFMSPEQASGRANLLGPRSDVYCLGATLYYLLTGRPPRDTNRPLEADGKPATAEIARPRTLNTRISTALEAICLKSLAPKPDDRYATALDLKLDLERWLADEPVTAFREPWPKRMYRWSKRHKTAVSTVAAVGLCSVLFAEAFTQWDRSRRLSLERLASTAVDEMNRLETESGAAFDLETADAAKLARALEIARKAEALLANEPDGKLKSEIRSALRLLSSQERDARLLAELEEARLSEANNLKDGRFDLPTKHKTFQEALQSYGLDVSLLSLSESIKRIQDSPATKNHIIAALYEWGMEEDPKSGLSRRLIDVAKGADDEQGKQIMEAITRKKWNALRTIAVHASAKGDIGPRVRLIMHFLADEDPTESLSLLETFHRTRRSDVWINFSLADAYHFSRPPNLEKAVRYYNAVVTLRPKSSGALGRWARASRQRRARRRIGDSS